MEKVQIIVDTVEWMEKENIPPEKIIEYIKWLDSKKKKVVVTATTKERK